jgi:hypothetical protein
MHPAPEFLDVADVIELHASGLALWGGSEGIRDPGALASAIAQPQATFDGEYLHGDLFSMAAAYAFHVAEAQAFVDGNKRAGGLAAIVCHRIVIPYDGTGAFGGEPAEHVSVHVNFRDRNGHLRSAIGVAILASEIRAVASTLNATWTRSLGTRRLPAHSRGWSNASHRHMTNRSQPADTKPAAQNRMPHL